MAMHSRSSHLRLRAQPVALVAGHWSACQAARVEVERQRQTKAAEREDLPGDMVQRMVGRRASTGLLVAVEAARESRFWLSVRPFSGPRAALRLSPSHAARNLRSSAGVTRLGRFTILPLGLETGPFMETSSIALATPAGSRGSSWGVMMTDIALPPEPALQFRVKLWGDIDIARVPELHYLVEDYRNGPATDIEIDLRDVTFMDSTGLGFMARLHRDAKDRGGSVTVTHPSHEVERVIRMTGMDHILMVRDDPT